MLLILFVLLDTRGFFPDDYEVVTGVVSNEQEYTNPGSKAEFGLKIELELGRSGQPFKTVPASTPICNGDSIAFHFVPNRDGFATVLNRGSSGKWSKIWPKSDFAGEFSNGNPIRLPVTGKGLPVSGPAGKELILIYFSSSSYSSELQQLGQRLLNMEEPSVAPSELTGGGSRKIIINNYTDLERSPLFTVGSGEQVVSIELRHGLWEKDLCVFNN